MKRFCKDGKTSEERDIKAQGIEARKAVDDVMSLANQTWRGVAVGLTVTQSLVFDNLLRRASFDNGDPALVVWCCGGTIRIDDFVIIRELPVDSQLLYLIDLKL